MNKMQLACLADTLLEVHGLASGGWKFKWNTHKTSFGLCSHRKKTVELSAWLYENTKDDAQFIDTVKHEVAHALTPRCNHNWKWKRMAVKLGAIPKASAWSEKIDPLKDAKHVVVNTYRNSNDVVKSYFRKPPVTAYNKIQHQWLISKPHTKGFLKIVTVEDYKMNYS